MNKTRLRKNQMTGWKNKMRLRIHVRQIYIKSLIEAFNNIPEPNYNGVDDAFEFDINAFK